MKKRPYFLLLLLLTLSAVVLHTGCMSLSRKAIAELPEYEIITIGGFHIGDIIGNQSLHRRVQAFNRFSQTHQIEIVDYFDVYGSEDHHFSEFRYLLDIITNSGPDIFLGEISSFTDLAERGFLVDLYTLIDQDPILNRSDFFPNIMGAIEAPDGSLPAISNGFRIETIIGMANVAGDIKSWTFAEMLSLVEQTENSDITFILGEWMTAERFLDIALEFSGNDFINWPEKTSNLDSVEFIQLLEISSRLPNVMAPWDFNNLTSPITRMLNGEQLLDIIDLNNIHNYQMHTAMLGDDIVALGLPSHSGGSHLIHIPSGFAINTNSTQKDVAWSFIRQFLLPDVSQDELIGGFPLRLDLFEEMIIEAKTPLFEVDEDGKEVETPKIGMGQSDFMVWIYALTETEEHGLRAIIENAHILGSSNETVMNIVREETSTYFAGGRSAADTARVLQNRIQIFLYEIE